MEKCRSKYMLVSIATLSAACSAPDTRNGEQLFEQTCRTCHGQGKLPGSLAIGLTDPVKRNSLDQFLAQHHAADPAVRTEIINYLAAQDK